MESHSGIGLSRWIWVSVWQMVERLLLLIQRMSAFFPFPSVERLDRELLQVYPFKTADVDINLVRMRAGNVIRVNPTHRAKIMLGRLGIELVEHDLWVRSQ